MPFYLVPPNRVIHADLDGYTKIDKDTKETIVVEPRKDVLFVELSPDATGRKPLKQIAGRSIADDGSVVGYLFFEKD